MLTLLTLKLLTLKLLTLKLPMKLPMSKPQVPIVPLTAWKLNRRRASSVSSVRQKHVPLRRCVVCRTQRPQNALLRLYRDNDGVWHLDPSSKAGGRGAWVCLPAHNPSCTNASSKQLARFFRGQAEGVHRQFQQYVQGASQPPVSSSATQTTNTVTEDHT